MTLKKLSIAAAVAAFFAPTLVIAAPATAADLQKQINQLQKEINQMKATQAKTAPEQVTITPASTTPLLGVESAYDGSDLISNFSSINEDLTLLETRNKFEAALDKESALAERPRLLFSGYINLDAAYMDPQYFGAPLHQTSLNITAATLQTTAYVSPWVNAFVELKWNSGPGQNAIKANRAFITVGKLNSKPFYGSIGTMYVPFGRYSTSMISDPVTKQMGRALSTQGALLAGFSKPSVSAQVFGFKGNSFINGKSDDIIGADANYYAHYNHGSAQLGAGMINNLSESIGLQSYGYFNQAPTGSTAPTGFSGLSMSKQVPAYDVNAQASYNAFMLTTEFLGTTTAYATQDLSFNTAGAKPKALHVEGIYNFKIINRPSSAGLFFDHTSQALGLGMPENSLGAMFNTEVAKDLLFAAQYSHNTDYKTTDAATGLPTGATKIIGTNKSQNIYYLQLAAYF
jgi:hypothetical protein